MSAETPTDSPVRIFSEFQQLEEVIVGRAYPPESFRYIADDEHRSGLMRILEETEEDLQTLCKLLTDMGVVVRRPEVHFQLGRDGAHKKFDLQTFSFQFPNHPLMPRDTVVVAGSTLLETFTRSQNRFFENWSYRQLFAEYFAKGAGWVSMPMPMLTNEADSYHSYAGRMALYHAANILKCGRDIFYSQPSNAEFNGKGTELGLNWFKRMLGDQFRFHPAPCAGHLDGKLALLKPGLLATWSRDFIPEALRSWDAIIIEGKSPLPESFLQIKKQRFYKDFVVEWLTEWIGYVDETVFDVNMFSVRENLVITNGYNAKVYADFKRHGIEAIPWNFRHQYFWDGAIHCVTLDIRRGGEQESYL